MLDLVQIGINISNHRKSLGLTQDELAEKLFVSRQALSKWELGNSLPSTDLQIELSKIFSITLSELLLLDEDIKINKNDIFKGHSRAYVLRKIVSGEFDLNIPDEFYQFSPEERMLILKAIKEKKISCNLDELRVKLTPSELKYLGGLYYVEVLR